MHSDFQDELRESLYVHRPLPLHREKDLESGFLLKTAAESRVLFDQNFSFAVPAGGGCGTVCREGGELCLRAPLRAEHWPEGAALDGDYSNFGTARMDFAFPAEDWQGFHRIRFRVLPQIRGARIAHLNVSVRNVGNVPIPDPYFREGATVFDVDTGVWNECVWEFAAMPRDAICQLSFYVFCSGHDIGAGETLCYQFDDIRLERIEQPEHELGWENPNPGIRLSSVGYWPEGRKTAVGTVQAEQFSVVDAKTGKAVYTGSVETVCNARGRFQVLDFSGITECGRYFLCAGDITSPEFDIAHDLERESLWKVLNFFFCERCGFPVPGKHGTCHQDILAVHAGKTVSFGGGWHDAGDVSQQTAQSGEIVWCLLENAQRCTDDMLLRARLLEEAQWGLDFLLRIRFGDGYRATSAGATRITDNFIGTFDDIPARVHNHAYENFLFAGIEAYAAQVLAQEDPKLASNALEAAKEDFGFAQQEFARTGVDPAQMYEHTYNSGLSQYYAVIVLAASCLYAATGTASYAAEARDYARKLLACQECGGPVPGFFYRDESHKTIVHFNHQSREHQFLQALDWICRTQPEAAERPDWEQAMRRYGEYLKAIAGNTAPYGMLPAGIHKDDEWQDAATFPYLHITCDYDAERENYRSQLAAGRALGGGLILRNFPVWFSFRGNSAVMLSMGKAAAIVGNYFQDEALLQLGREQMYWMWGKNPFGQSLIYGAGSNYCRQYAVLCGECVGEVPVGIETAGNDDLPYWPQNNNATFREVWVGAASRWMLLCAEFTKKGGAV